MLSLPISCSARRSPNHAMSQRELVAVRGPIRRGFYAHARGSAMEAAAALDTTRVMKLVADDGYQPGIDLLEGIVAMLTKMT